LNYTGVFIFQLRAVETGGANDILHLLFCAKGLDNKVNTKYVHFIN